MTKITEAAGQVIAAGITEVFHMTDRMLLDSARLQTNVLEGTERSGLHPRQKQMLLERMHNAAGKFLEGRKDMIQAHRAMIDIQGQSNLQTVDFGCWTEGPHPDAPQRAGFFTGAEDRTVPVR